MVLDKSMNKTKENIVLFKNISTKKQPYSKE